MLTRPAVPRPANPVVDPLPYGTVLRPGWDTDRSRRAPSLWALLVALWDGGLPDRVSFVDPPELS